MDGKNDRSRIQLTAMNERQATEVVRCRDRLPLRRYVSMALAALVLLGFVTWRALMRKSVPSATAALTEGDKREIAMLCRRHTAWFAINKLREGEFGWFFRSTRVLFQQKIDRFFDDQDGTYRCLRSYL